MPTPAITSKGARTTLSKLQQHIGAQQQQQLMYDPATFTTQLPCTSAALAVEGYSITLAKKPTLPLHALVETAALAMSLALARKNPAVSWDASPELQALRALFAP